MRLIILALCLVSFQLDAKEPPHTGLHFSKPSMWRGLPRSRLMSPIVDDKGHAVALATKRPDRIEVQRLIWCECEDNGKYTGAPIVLPANATDSEVLAAVR